MEIVSFLETDRRRWLAKHLVEFDQGRHNTGLAVFGHRGA